MALPAHILERLPPSIVRGSSIVAQRESAHALPLGIDELDLALPDGGLLRGGVVELAVTGGAGLATSVALLACRAAQRESVLKGGDVPWCAFVDPTATLYGPGVAQAGVALDRLLVVQPSADALGRTSLRIVESQAFAVTVIDTAGAPGAALNVALGSWPRILRRMSMALNGVPNVLLLITDSAVRRPLPLPVAMRIELMRTATGKLSLAIAKDNRGRIARARSIAWTRPTSQSELNDGWARTG